MAKHPGQPTVMTQETLDKLKEAFLIGCTNDEACFWAGISTTAYYDYLKLKPEYADKVDAWKCNPIVKARNTIMKSLDQPETARWYLERKSKDEFGTRTELTGAGGKPLIPEKISDADKEEVTKKLKGLLDIMNNDESANKDGNTIQSDTNGTVE